DKPSIVLPGGGGIQMDLFMQPKDRSLRSRFGISEGIPLVCNPRGFRAYIRNDTFFRAAALVAQRRPETLFIAVGMKDNPVAERWITSLGLGTNIRLLPKLSRPEMA